MRLGICTGGGDCPGLNAAIRAIVRHATLNYKAECVGIIDSLNGLLFEQPHTIDLGLSNVVDVLDKGGTILGTYNRGNIYNTPEGQEQIKRTIAGIKKARLDALFIIGGEGTQNMAKILANNDVNVIGIPKTIDNDLPGTDQTIGFATCAEFVADSVARLRSTAESHKRIMVAEVMGRDSGFIALHGGIAGGANVILIPEIPFSYDKIIETIEKRNQMGRKFSLIVISEGAFPKGGQRLFEGQNTGVANLGGIGSEIASELYKRTKHDTRYTVLGHLQRGGSPNATDRIFASSLGVAAVDLAMKGSFKRIVVQRDGFLTSIPYEKMAGGRRTVATDNQVLHTAKAMGICLG